MRKELEQRLVERWPTWFNTKGDFRYTGMTLGFQHDDGWFGILWRLCEDLEPLVAEFERDWGVCGNPASHRAGLLTFEHQGCPQFEQE